MTAEERNIGEVYQIAPTFTNVNQYVEPLRCSLEWWDLKQLEQKHSFSSWNPKGTGVSNYIPVTEVSVTPPGVADAGAFYFRVWDTEKIIDPLTVRRKGIVIIKVKKYEAEPEVNLMYGFVQKVRPQREGTQLYYIVSGIGSGVLMNERYVNLNRTAKMQSLDSTTPIFNDETMQVRRLYKELLSNKDLYAVDDLPISKQFTTEMDMTPLDNSRVKASLLAINEPYVTVSHALNVLLDSVGADGGINAYNKPYLDYPTSQVSGIVLKSWDTVAESGFDKAANTAYFMNDWDYEIDWSKESGFANRLLAKSRVTEGVATSASEGAYQGFVNLADRDLAQRIPASPARFTNISIIVARRGIGTTKPETIKALHGHIHQDLGNAPIGPRIATFDIPLTSIPEDTPTPMFLNNLKFSKPVDPSTAHWITLYDRGEVEDNTINWYFTADPKQQSANAVRPRLVGSPWTNDHESNSGWEVAVNNSFAFAFSIFDHFTHLIIAEDVDSQQRYGIVEDLVDVSFATNTIAANKYLGELLGIRSLPKISYHTNKVTIPGNLFLPGIVVSIEDAMTDLNPSDSMTGEVTQASYNFGGGGDTQLGCLFADINLVGHYDYKLVGSDIISIGDET
jgi:hypothetical protein